MVAAPPVQMLSGNNEETREEGKSLMQLGDTGMAGGR